MLGLSVRLETFAAAGPASVSGVGLGQAPERVGSGKQAGCTWRVEHRCGRVGPVINTSGGENADVS